MNKSITVLTNTEIASVAGGGGENSGAFVFLNPKPIFPEMDKNALVGKPISFSPEMKNDIVVKPCDIGKVGGFNSTQTSDKAGN